MSWKPRSIIRNKQTGKPLLVLHSYKAATIVVDLEDGRNPTPTLVLLERDYVNWVDERYMQCKTTSTATRSNPDIGWTIIDYAF